MGLLVLVLHTHLPYVRRNGVWPCGEDFFHQAATESYLPLLGTLERLADRGLEAALSIGITPVLAHQMQDPHMLRELTLYLGRHEGRALRQVANYDGIFASEVKDLAAFYARHGRAQLARLESLPGGIAGGFRALEDAGVIEVLSGPATHPFLPRVSEPAMLRAQISLGAAEHLRIFGRAARGVWIPECAWRPGTEGLLEDMGTTHLVVDGPTMTAAGRSVFRPARIADSEVAVLGRHVRISELVSSDGYPIDPWYRDFHHYDMEAGFKNWRVTGHELPLAGKRPYEPEPALARARAHAEDFVAEVSRALDEQQRETHAEGVVVACFDTELLGHWWFEGPTWLERVYEILAEHPSVRPASLERALEVLGPGDPVRLAGGTWGVGHDDRSWVAPETEDMWKALAEVEAETVRLARADASAEARNQLVREALLLQSSDWPFMVLQGRNAGYARERFEGHRARWGRLATLVAAGAPDAASEAAQIFEIDNLFPGPGLAARLPG